MRQRGDPIATPSIWSETLPSKRKWVPDKAKSKSFFSSFLVISKSGLCSNNKPTAISTVSFKGIVVPYN